MSKRQFLFVVACFIQSSFLYTIYYYGSIGNEAWISFLGGIVGGILLAILYSKLCSFYPKMGLAEINKCVFGKFLGNVISVVYVATFVLSCSRLLREAGQFVSGNILIGSDWIYILIALVLLCAWASRNGVKYFSSVATFMCISLFLVTIFFFVLLVPQMHLDFLLPLGKGTFVSYLKSFLLSATMPFSELAILMTLVPEIDFSRDKSFMARKGEKVRNRALDDSGKKRFTIRKEFILGVIIGSAFILVTIFRDTFVLGVLLDAFSYPGYEAIRLIDYRLLSHIESLYGAALIFLMFFKSALIFYCITKILADVFECKKNVVFSAFLVGVVVLVSENMWESNIQLRSFVMNYVPYILLAVNVGLPLVSVVISAVKGRLNKV